MGIGTKEIAHVEMLSVMLGHLLEGVPSGVAAKAAEDNPILGAVQGGTNPQQAIVSGGSAMPTNSMGVLWNAGYIVGSGNLLTVFQSNVEAEGQSRLQESRLYSMTDDPGIKAMLKYNLARDTYHQQQWLLVIEQLIADGYTERLEDSHKEEDKTQHHTFWSFTEGSKADEGAWATWTTNDGQRIEFLLAAQPASNDDGTLSPPDPKLFAPYDMLDKVKDKLT